MRRLFGIMALSLLLVGCTSQGRYVEGSHISLGLLWPTDTQVYGVNLLDWLSGITVRCPTNQTMTIEREFSVTNSYFGVVNTRETTRTRITTDGR